MIKHIHVNECDSTQDLLKEQLKVFKDTQEILVSCNTQFKGRGRGDHKWEALAGSLCFSVTISPNPIASFTAIELSLLIAKFFEGSILHLKWPNDILNKHQKKCCGILVQGHHGLMIAGIGLNLHSNHPHYGGIYDSSFEFDKNSWSLEMAEFILANRYENELKLKQDWEERCEHMNEFVRITEANQNVDGIFRGLGVHGEAILETTQGERHLYNGSLTKINPDH
jgi:BirA family transcriptional regulator, biotin operon repressor / biotin---[acetyl-CoA-carboxylase] ligase